MRMEKFIQDLDLFNFKSAFSAFMVLFVSIDIIGAIPIVLSLKEKGQAYSANKVTLYTFIMLIAFLFVGEPMLNFFSVDINSFGVAGAIVLFVLAVEMLFGVQVFKDDASSGGNATIVPLVFPLFAGAASFTAMLTLRTAGFAYSNILFAIVLNSMMIWLMLRFVIVLERWLGKGGIYILRKFFGVILLALSIKFFIDNLLKVIEMFHPM